MLKVRLRDVIGLKSQVEKGDTILMNLKKKKTLANPLRKRIRPVARAAQTSL